MHKSLLLSILLSLFLARPATTPWPAQAQAGDARALIAEVNALRASYGLPPYRADNSLMNAAKGHSNYQAQIGTWTHIGPGGSRPHDRAVIAGYGNGAQVYVSENVAMGIDLNPDQVVNEIWQDVVHLETMISSGGTLTPMASQEARDAPPIDQKTAVPQTSVSAGRQAARMPTEESPALALASDPAQTPMGQTQGSLNADLPKKHPDYLLIAVISLAVSGFSLVLLGSALKRSGV